MKYFIIFIYIMFFASIYGVLSYISQRPGIVFLAALTAAIQVWVQFILTDYFDNK